MYRVRIYEQDKPGRKFAVRDEISLPSWDWVEEILRSGGILSYDREEIKADVNYHGSVIVSVDDNREVVITNE
jgi:hypothetical protein